MVSVVSYLCYRTKQKQRIFYMIKLNRNNKGAALTEYAVLAALIGGVSLGVTLDFGGQAQTTFRDIGHTVASAVLGETVTGNTPLSSEVLAEIENAGNWTGGAVCLYQSPWQYDGTEYNGIAVGPSGSTIQISVAFWFGPNPQTGTTANGSPILFSVSDTNEDGLIQTNELIDATGLDFVTHNNKIAYASTGLSGGIDSLMSQTLYADADGNFLIDDGDLITPMLSGVQNLDPAIITIGCD